MDSIHDKAELFAEYDDAGMKEVAEAYLVLEALCGELLGACAMAHSALDRLMGDSDLDDDDSPEMLACLAIVRVQAKAQALLPTLTNQKKE